MVSSGHLAFARPPSGRIESQRFEDVRCDDTINARKIAPPDIVEFPHPRELVAIVVGGSMSSMAHFTARDRDPECT